MISKTWSFAHSLAGLSGKSSSSPFSFHGPKGWAKLPSFGLWFCDILGAHVIISLIPNYTQWKMTYFPRTKIIQGSTKHSRLSSETSGTIYRAEGPEIVPSLPCVVKEMTKGTFAFPYLRLGASKLCVLFLSTLFIYSISITPSKKPGDSVLVRFGFSKLPGKHFNLSATTAPTGAKNWDGFYQVLDDLFTPHISYLLSLIFGGWFSPSDLRRRFEIKLDFSKSASSLRRIIFVAAECRCHSTSGRIVLASFLGNIRNVFLELIQNFPHNFFKTETSSVHIFLANPT